MKKVYTRLWLMLGSYFSVIKKYEDLRGILQNMKDFVGYECENLRSFHGKFEFSS